MYKNYQILDDNFNAKEWIDEFPFLRIKDASCTYYDENTDEFCWLNDIPIGWVKAFGRQMCTELSSVLGEHKDKWVIIQLKEKYGGMRLYWRWEPEDCTAEEYDKFNPLHDAIESVINKYIKISRQTCYKCGKQDAHMTYGLWIIPMCSDCEKR